MLAQHMRRESLSNIFHLAPELYGRFRKPKRSKSKSTMFEPKTVSKSVFISRNSEVFAPQIGAYLVQEP